MSKLKNFLLILLAAILGLADGHFLARHTWCIFNSEDLNDTVLIDAYIFNQIPFLQFNSTVGEYEGYTAFGIKNANRLNNITERMQVIKAQREIYCIKNAKIFARSIYYKTVEPQIEVKLVKQSDGSTPSRLMCSAYSFYPPNIKVTWVKDGKEVKADVTSIEEMADGDWYYQVHSHLEFMPKTVEDITCVVEHASASKPFVYKWNPSISEPDKIMIGVGTAGLLLGLLLPAAGYIYYRKKPSGGWNLILC